MPQAFPPLSPEYDAFLYAIVCNENDGMYLTMASLIARSGADPWIEAARISKLRKDAALRVLARLIPSEKCEQHESAHNHMTMDQLFSLLPKSRPAVTINIAGSSRIKSVFIKNAGAVVAAALCIFVVFIYLLTTRL